VYYIAILYQHLYSKLKVSDHVFPVDMYGLYLFSMMMRSEGVNADNTVLGNTITLNANELFLHIIYKILAKFFLIDSSECLIKLCMPS
jgi:hypothetical protein